MPRSTKPCWGASALYELKNDSSPPLPDEIERDNFRIATGVDTPKPFDLTDVSYDASTIRAWSRQAIPERRRISQALSEVGQQLGELESALGLLSPATRSKLGIIDRSNLFDPEWGAEATLLMEFSRQLVLLSRCLRRFESQDLVTLRAHIDACADIFGRLDDFSQGHLLDGLWEQRVASSAYDPANYDTAQWFLTVSGFLRSAAEQEARHLSLRGRDDHPWVHWVVSMLAECYRQRTNKDVTYVLDVYNEPARTPGAEFIIGVIRASGARITENTIFNSIRRAVLARRARSRSAKTQSSESQ